MLAVQANEDVKGASLDVGVDLDSDSIPDSRVFSIVDFNCLIFICCRSSQTCELTHTHTHYP